MSTPTLKEFAGFQSGMQAAEMHQRLVDIKNAILPLSVVNAALSVYGAGTAYQLTNAQAAIDLGTTDPVKIINVAGTWLLLASLQLEATGATITTQTATLKLRRTNNTAADLTGSSVTIDLPVMTTLTHTIGRFSLPPVIYTTTNTDDSLTIFGGLSAAAGAGTIDVSAASIVAVRLS